MGDFRHQFDADDVTIFPSKSPGSNSRRIDQNSHPNPHPNSYVDFASGASMNAGEMSIRREEEEEEARTVTYLDRIGRRIVDKRTTAEKIRDYVKEGCGKVVITSQSL